MNEHSIISKGARRFIIVAILLLIGISIHSLLNLRSVRYEIKGSSSLKAIISTDDLSYRVEYVDENGIVTVAADKGYAIHLITRDSGCIIESFYDDHENPIMQKNGFFSIRRELDETGNECRLYYLDFNGMPVMTGYGYAISERSFDDKNRIELEIYFDDNYEPVRTPSFGFGRRNYYDNDDNNLEIHYLGINKEDECNPAGFAILRRSFYSDGKVANEFYFDESDQPVSLSLGQYGLHKEYDELGRNNILTYLDADGQPIVTKAGYTTVKRTFYPDDTVKTEMYFDLDGNPVALSRVRD